MKLIGNFLLLVLALILFPILFIPNFVLVLLNKGCASGYFRSTAVAIDRFASGEYRTLWNTIFIKKILLISFFMVTGMSLCMSFLATIAEYGLKSGFITMFMKTELKNFIMAFPLQIILVGPIARFIFFKVFPLEPINA